MDRAWFSHLVRHLARKRSRSILTIPEPARGHWSMILLHIGCPPITQTTVTGRVSVV